MVDPRYLYAQQLESGVNTLTIPFAHSLVALQSIFGALHDMHALTACQYPEVIRKDNGEPSRAAPLTTSSSKEEPRTAVC